MRAIVQGFPSDPKVLEEVVATLETVLSVGAGFNLISKFILMGSKNNSPDLNRFPSIMKAVKLFPLDVISRQAK